MPRSPELLPDENSATVKFSELIPKLADLTAQGCYVNHLRWLENGYELRWIPPDRARHYRAWDQAGSLSTGPGDPVRDSETSRSSRDTGEVRQRELGLKIG